VSDASSQTIVHATLLAKGGENSGKGGQIETSGMYLNVENAEVSTLAADGSVGDWLLDPYSIRINGDGEHYSYSTSGTNTFQSNGGYNNVDGELTSFISASAIESALSSNSVTIQTTVGGTTGNGDITIQNDGSISYTGSYARTLTFLATRNFQMDGGANITSSNASLVVNINVNAQHDSNGGAVNIESGTFTTNGGSINIGAGPNRASFPNSVVIGRDINTGSGQVNIKANSLVLQNGNTITSVGAKNFVLGPGISTIAGNLAGSGGLNKGGDGILVLDGTNGYTGATNIDAGTLTLGSNLTHSPVTVSSGAVLNMTGTKSVNSIAGSGTINSKSNSASILSIVGSNDTTFSGLIRDNGGDGGSMHLVKNGAGTLTITGSNLASNTTVYDGTLAIGGSGKTYWGAYNVGSSGALSINGLGTYNFSGTLNGPTTLTGNTTLNPSGALTFNGAVSGASHNLTVNMNSVHALTFGGAVNVNNLTASANTGAININNNITAQNKINVNTNNSNITINGNLASGSTANDAIVLNAGKNVSAGTATGGNIIHSSGAVTTGTGGRATLYTGSVSGSTGVTNLVGSGSGKFRYNSNESATNFTTPLGSGVYAVYRERPTIFVNPQNQTITYGDADPTLDYTTTGFVNGDTDGILNGTANVTINSTKSTSGHHTAGTHNISYSNGLSNNLGYAIAES